MYKQKLNAGFFDGVESVVILGNIANLPKKMFYNCASLEKIILPESIASIDDYAFYSCKSLQQINLPTSIKSIWK